MSAFERVLGGREVTTTPELAGRQSVAADGDVRRSLLLDQFHAAVLRTPRIGIVRGDRR
jgi:hypothetical protein